MKVYLLKIITLSIILLLKSLTTASQTVTPWLTSGDKSRLIKQQNPVYLNVNSGSANEIIYVDPETVYQEIDGFGFCLTQGSAEVISSLTISQQNSLLSELFDKANGLGISVLRIGIGATDLNSTIYSYNETSGDVNMNKFSLNGPDLNYLIPVLKKILAINPEIKILASPWTAPRWMKTNGSWTGGSLKTTSYTAYAKYFIKYFDAMKAHGINIWAITPQNEPENGANEPSMLMSMTEQKNFINLYLGPLMANNGYSGIKIIAFDHNCDNTSYPIEVCNGSTYVDGAAFHLYAGDISALTTVKNRTGKNVYFTEQYTSSTGSFSDDFSWHLQNVILGALNNSAKTVIEWNLATNSNFGPRTSGGCSTCQGAITVNSSTSFSRNVSYYIIGQISKFVKPGAVRIKAANSSPGYVSAGFKNPDGSIAVLIYNNKSSSQVFKVLVGSKSFFYTVPANTAATFVWDTDLNAIPDTRIDNFVISPNPVNEFIILKAENDDMYFNSADIISMNGEIVLNCRLSNNIKIDVSALSKGCYILRMNGKKGPQYSRFIKQ